MRGVRYGQQRGSSAQRLFCCELVTSIHLTPAQSRCWCLKIPPWRTVSSVWICFGVWRQGVFLSTAGLAQGSFISWINGSFFGGIFNTRLSDNRSLVAVTTPVTNRAPPNGDNTGNAGLESCFRPPYCQPDPANEFCLTVSEPHVAAWHRSLSGPEGQLGC